MAYLNDNYLKLKAGYLFPEIGRRVKAFTDANPEAAKRLIRCGIGDVTEPLPPAVIAAMHAAVDEMASRATFKGYGPEQGYEWLRAAIAQNDFRAHGLAVADDEIFVSDGSKCDCGAILDILGDQNRLAISDPVYPVYVDTNVMAGHTGEADESGAYAGITYLPCTAQNGFIPEPPAAKVDVIYLCSPNNPTGAAATRPQLEAWVKYALANQAIILFDAAYEAYITEPGVPHSIYEIPGARECAIEFRSFSKNGGFTGTRCAFTVVPKTLLASTAARRRVFLRGVRRHTAETVHRGTAVFDEFGFVSSREDGRSKTHLWKQVPRAVLRTDGCFVFIDETTSFWFPRRALKSADCYARLEVLIRSHVSNCEQVTG